MRYAAEHTSSPASIAASSRRIETATSLNVLSSTLPPSPMTAIVSHNRPSVRGLSVLRSTRLVDSGEVQLPTRWSPDSIVRAMRAIDCSSFVSDFPVPLIWFSGAAEDDT